MLEAILIFISIVLFGFPLLNIAKKTNTSNGWLGFIPIANVYLMTQIAKLPWWWTLSILLVIIPVLGSIVMIVAMVYIWWKIAERLGKPGWWSLLMLVPIVNLIMPFIIAWGKIPIAQKGEQNYNYKYEENNTCYQKPNEAKYNGTEYLPDGYEELLAMFAKLAACDGDITDKEKERISKLFINDLYDSSYIDTKTKDYIKSYENFNFYANRFYIINRNNISFLNEVVKLLIDFSVINGQIGLEEERLIKQTVNIFKTGEQYLNAFVNEKDVKENKYAKVLCLHGNITKDDIKKSYRNLATQYHPDKVVNLGEKLRKVAEEEMKEINLAYEYFRNKYNI